MLKLMKMEVKEYDVVDDTTVGIEFEYQTHRNDTITFELDLKDKQIHDLKVDGIIGIEVLEELKTLIQDAKCTIYYSDYIQN